MCYWFDVCVSGSFTRASLGELNFKYQCESDTHYVLSTVVLLHVGPVQVQCYSSQV